MLDFSDWVTIYFSVLILGSIGVTWALFYIEKTAEEMGVEPLTTRQTVMGNLRVVLVLAFWPIAILVAPFALKRLMDKAE